MMTNDLEHRANEEAERFGASDIMWSLDGGPLHPSPSGRREGE